MVCFRFSGLLRLFILGTFILGLTSCAGATQSSLPTPIAESERVSAALGKTPTAVIEMTPTPDTREPTVTPTATPNLAITNRWQYLGPTENASVSAIAVSPDYANDATIYVGTLTNTGTFSGPFNESVVTGGVFRTRDGGLSWRDVSTTLSKWGITTLALSPEFPKDKTIFAGTYAVFPGSDGKSAGAVDARLSRSRDGGLNWSSAQTDLPNQRVNALVFSPDYTDDRTVFVAIGGLDQQRLSPPRGGVYKSTNGGVRWAPAGYGLPPDLPATAIGFSLDFASSGAVFVSTVSGGGQPSDRGGVFRSLDKGLDWLSMASGMPPEFAHARNFAVSPNYAEDFTLFAAAGACCGDVKGIYKSINGGATWKAAFAGIDDFVETVIISPRFASDSTLYCVTRSSGVFRSANGGLSWLPLNDGLPALSGTTLALIPGESNILLVGTKDRGLWRYVDKR